MKKVMFIVSSLKFGGAELHTVNLANLLSLKDFELYIAGIENFDNIKKKVRDNIHVRLFNKKSFIDIKTINEIRNYLNEIRPDIIIAVNAYSTLIAFLSKLFSDIKIPFASILHSTMISDKKEKLKGFLYRRIINNTDKIIFISNSQKEYWQDKYSMLHEKCIVIHNGISDSWFSTYFIDKNKFKTDLGFDKNDLIISINAVMRKEKKHEDLIDALEILLKEGYRMKLLFIGDGIRRNEIEEYIDKKNLKDFIRITGFVTDVRPYIYISDIVAIVSSTETLSLAVIEGMAMKKPIIHSNVGSVKELVINNCNGLIFESGNIHQLVNSIKLIIDNKRFESMGLKSYEYFKMFFTDDIMMDKYKQVIQELISSI